MGKIRRQADRRKASKWEMYAGSDRLQRWQGKQQDKTTGRQARGKQVGNVCRKRQAAEVAGK